MVGAVRLPLEEVCDPAPPVRDEHALVDDVHAGRDRLFCLTRRPLPVEVGLEADLDDVPPFRPEPLEVGELVLAALAEDELGLLVLDPGQRQVAAGDPDRERGQMLARQIVRDIRGRERKAAGDDLHAKSLGRNGASSYATLPLRHGRRSGRDFCIGAARSKGSSRRTFDPLDIETRPGGGPPSRSRSSNRMENEERPSSRCFAKDRGVATSQPQRRGVNVCLVSVPRR
jgi:hypothetical protein